MRSNGVTMAYYQGITWFMDSAASIKSSATELRESMMAVTRQMRRHRPDHGLTLSQLELLGEVSRTGVTTPAELGGRLHVRVQSLTDSINELLGRGLIERRPDESDRRRQLIEITDAGAALLEADRAERDAWLHATMRDNLSQLEFDLLMLVAPVLRKLAYTDAKAGTLAP
jgi:DNA-binding MarR family transcriptional regulator